MIIGICGHKGSGKSTVASMLEELLGYEVTMFAQRLKEATCALSGCTMQDLESQDFKENTLVPDYLMPYIPIGVKPTYRAFLQYWGTEVMRKYNDNIWVDSTLSACGNDVIISDVRFPNEVKAIRSKGGLIIKVERPGYEGDGHTSEASVDTIEGDFVIENNGSLFDLLSDVLSIVDFIDRVDDIKHEDDMTSLLVFLSNRDNIA